MSCSRLPQETTDALTNQVMNDYGAQSVFARQARMDPLSRGKMTFTRRETNWRVSFDARPKTDDGLLARLARHHRVRIV